MMQIFKWLCVIQGLKKQKIKDQKIEKQEK